MFRRRFKGKENRSSAVYSEDEATRNANSKNKRWFKNDLSEFLKEIELKNWDKVRRALESDPALLCGSVEDRIGLSPLTIAVTSYAPVEIIRMMIDSNPASATITDEFGATPLHLACLNGTTPDVVSLLLEQYQGSEEIADNNNYTVLHHAVEHACLLIEKRYSQPQQQGLEASLATFSISSELDDYLEIIKLLCRAAPEMVFCATDSNDLPLDIPQVILLRIEDQQSDMVRKLEEVYQLLKETSIHVYRKRRAIWENSSHQSSLGQSDKKYSNCERSLHSLSSSVVSSSCVSTNVSSLDPSNSLS